MEDAKMDWKGDWFEKELPYSEINLAVPSASEVNGQLGLCGKFHEQVLPTGS